MFFVHFWVERSESRDFCSGIPFINRCLQVFAAKVKQMSTHVGPLDLWVAIFLVLDL
jgi:hypothetical protein